MAPKKPSLRQRVWGGEKADARQVGESLRGMDAAIGGIPQFRIVPFDNQVYPPDGLAFEASRLPQAVLCIHAEKADGTLTPASVNALKFNGKTVVAKLSGLTASARYATIRLLVIG